MVKSQKFGARNFCNQYILISKVETRMGPTIILKKYKINVRFPGVKIDNFETVEGNNNIVHQNVIVQIIEPDLKTSIL